MPAWRPSNGRSPRCSSRLVDRQGRAAHDPRAARGTGRQAQAEGGQARQPAPPGAAPRAGARPVRRRPVRRRPATWPTARCCRPSTSSAGRTCCPTSSCSSRSADGRTSRMPSGPRSRASLAKYSRVPGRARRSSTSSCARIVYHQGDFDDPSRVRPARRRASTDRPRARHRAATGCSTWPPSRRPSPRSSASSAGPASTTRSTAAAGGGSSSRSRSGATSTRRSA